MPVSRDDVEGLKRSVEERCAYHKRMAERQKGLVRDLGIILSLLIPIISAFVMVAAGEEILSRSGIFWVGFVLTVLTIINSVFKPAERYRILTQVLISLHDLGVDLEANMKKFNLYDTADINTAYSFLQRKHKELSEIGMRMAEGVIGEVQKK